MSSERILFVEDDRSGLEMAVFNLTKAGFQVDAATTGERGLELFDPALHDLVITDVRMPGMSGMELLLAIKARAPDVPVLVVTAYAKVELAVEAMKAGAFDFIGKPFNRDHLLLAVKKALDTGRLKREVTNLRARLGGVEREIVYRSQVMQKMVDLVDRVAVSDATVLVTGASGTGKELVARRLHARSRRSAEPFVAVNVAAIPAELLESELFGHERGAFTGASAARKGHFRRARGGTLFLDEIAELPYDLQGKLLRVLEERVIQVLGTDKAEDVDVRVVVATNRELPREVEAGRFREDLYYRINVVEVSVPALDTRIEDLEPLVEYFVSRFSDGREYRIPEQLMNELRARPWPGNVRELQNICQRLVLLSEGEELSIDVLPGGLGGPKAVAAADVNDILEKWPPLPEGGLSLIDLERGVIERVLEMKQGNVTQAAAYLRIPRHVLAYRMEKYGIQRKG